MCRLSWNLGASASWNPQGLAGPVKRLLYLLCFPSRASPGNRGRSQGQKLYFSVTICSSAVDDVTYKSLFWEKWNQICTAFSSGILKTMMLSTDSPFMLRRPNRNYRSSLPGGPAIPICSTLLVASLLQLRNWINSWWTHGPTKGSFHKCALSRYVAWLLIYYH